MNDRSVASVKPTATHYLLSRFRVVVVAGHDHVAARNNFALRGAVARHFASLLINDAQLAGSHQLHALPRFDLCSLG